MDKRTIILLVVLFALLVAGMFIFAFIKKGEITQPLEPAPEVEEPIEVPYSMVDRIEAKHFFDGTTHTFVGEILLPTPCDLLAVDALVMESFPEQIQLNFTVINNAEACIQVVTAQRFKVSATASSAEATVSATFMGRAIPLNLIPAMAGETPEEFELFIKG